MLTINNELPFSYLLGVTGTECSLFTGKFSTMRETVQFSRKHFSPDPNTVNRLD